MDQTHSYIHNVTVARTPIPALSYEISLPHMVAIYTYVFFFFLFCFHCIHKDYFTLNYQLI